MVEELAAGGEVLENVLVQEDLAVVVVKCEATQHPDYSGRGDSEDSDSVSRIYCLFVL